MPWVSEVVVQVAWPPDNGTAPHPEIAFEPARKLTVPLGVPELPATCAVNVTDCPAEMT